MVCSTFTQPLPPQMNKGLGVHHPCPRCGKLIAVGIRYCEACRPMAEQQREEAIAASRRKYERSRDPKFVRFYKSAVWRRTSAAKLNMQRECEAGLDGCEKIACEVHHIKPLRTDEGWRERLEWGNLMSVCVRCHNKLDGKWGKNTGKPRLSAGDDVIDLADFKSR